MVLYPDTLPGWSASSAAGGGAFELAPRVRCRGSETPESRSCSRGETLRTLWIPGTTSSPRPLPRTDTRKWVPHFRVHGTAGELPPGADTPSADSLCLIRLQPKSLVSPPHCGAVIRSGEKSAKAQAQFSYCRSTRIGRAPGVDRGDSGVYSRKRRRTRPPTTNHSPSPRAPRAESISPSDLNAVASGALEISETMERVVLPVPADGDTRRA